MANKFKGVTKTTPDNFANDFIGLCKAYTDDVIEATFDTTQKVADKGASDLKSTMQPSPSSIGTAKPMNRRIWKTYAKGWNVKTKGGSNGDEYIHCIINNKSPNYRLTHLLENGHATRDGKRTRAFKHIEPINDECVKQLEEDIPKIIKKGGKL